MEDFEAKLREEIAGLCHGWGLQRSDLHKRIGPAVARWADVPPNATDVSRRVKQAVLRLLPYNAKTDSDAFALCVGLALHAEYSHRTLTARLQAMSDRLHVSTRTLHRRIKGGIADLAGQAAEEMEPVDPHRGWAVEVFRALVLLDRPQPEAIEERTIVAVADGLRRLVIRFSVPRTGLLLDEERDVEVEVQHGALLVDRYREGQGHFCFELELPVTLNRGDKHSFAMVVRVTDGKPIRDYYTYTPLNSCTSCEIHVRFAADRLPKALWRIEEAVPRVLADLGKTGADELRLDGVGEISQRFTRLHQGFGYGIGWRFG